MCVSCLEHFVNCSIYSLAELKTQKQWKNTWSRYKMYLVIDRPRCENSLQLGLDPEAWTLDAWPPRVQTLVRET